MNDTNNEETIDYQAQIEELRNVYTGFWTFESDSLQHKQEAASKYIPKFEQFTSTSQSGLDSQIDQKLKDGYQLIDEPLAKGVFPDGRHYCFMLRSEEALEQERIKVTESVRLGYLKYLEKRLYNDLPNFINSVIYCQEQLRKVTKPQLVNSAI